MSRIGKHPVEVPGGVTIAVEGQRITAKGKLGELATELPPDVIITHADGRVAIQPKDQEKVKVGETELVWQQTEAGDYYVDFGASENSMTPSSQENWTFSSPGFSLACAFKRAAMASCSFSNSGMPRSSSRFWFSKYDSTSASFCVWTLTTSVCPAFSAIFFAFVDALAFASTRASI